MKSQNRYRYDYIHSNPYILSVIFNLYILTHVCIALSLSIHTYACLKLFYIYILLSLINGNYTRLLINPRILICRTIRHILNEVYFSFIIEIEFLIKNYYSLHSGHQCLTCEFHKWLIDFIFRS